MKIDADRIKREIDLIDYIAQVSGSTPKRVGRSTFMNPCPFCGHKDHLSVSQKSSGEWVYNSFSNDCTPRGGSIFTFVEDYEEITGFKNILDHLARQFPIIETVAAQDSVSSIRPAQPSTTPTKTVESLPDLTEEFSLLQATMSPSNYFSSRGIGAKLQKKYKLCSHSEGMNHLIDKYSEFRDKKGSWSISFKHFIPLLNVDGTINHLIARWDDSSPVERPHKFHNLKDRDSRAFNDRYLSDPSQAGDYIFVTESAFDALSFEELGYSAIGINSTSNTNLVLAPIAQDSTKYKEKTFIIAADNDHSGSGMVNTLREGFTQHGVDFREYDLGKIANNQYKDANEFLQADRQGFEEATTSFFNRMEAPDLELDYMTEYVQEVNKNKRTQGIPTGFGYLDNKLGGGLFAGLYTVGAVSSLGKTTFVLQIADYVAANGQDVIFFSLEMAKAEIVSKSFSRITAEMALESNDQSIAQTTRSMLTGSAPKALFSQAYQRHLPTAKHKSLVEGNFKTNATVIRETVARYIKMRKTKPVVVVDYLQILQSENDRLTDKQAVDRNIVTMKQMSRDFDIPVILVSSFNRSSYADAVSFGSFKESGAIEYSSDVIMGLQLAAVHASAETQAEKAKKLDEAKAENPRKIELVILKNRNGVPFARLPYNFYSRFNMFEETKPKGDE